MYNFKAQHLANFVITLDSSKSQENEAHYLQGDTQPSQSWQILLRGLNIKISFSALWSDKANPASLLSISNCCPTSIHSLKRKAPVFHSTSLGLPPPPPPSPSSLLFPFPYSIWWWQSSHYAIFILSANPPTSPHTSALPSVLSYHPSPFAQLLWAILLWPQPINLLQLDNDL